MADAIPAPPPGFAINAPSAAPPQQSSPAVPAPPQGFQIDAAPPPPPGFRLDAPAPYNPTVPKDFGTGLSPDRGPIGNTFVAAAQNVGNAVKAVGADISRRVKSSAQDYVRTNAVDPAMAEAQSSINRAWSGDSFGFGSLPPAMPATAAEKQQAVGQLRQEGDAAAQRQAEAIEKIDGPVGKFIAGSAVPTAMTIGASALSGPLAAAAVGGAMGTADAADTVERRLREQGVEPEEARKQAGNVALASAPVQAAAAGFTGAGSRVLTKIGVDAAVGGIQDAAVQGADRAITGQPIDPKQIAAATVGSGVVSGAMRLAGAGAEAAMQRRTAAKAAPAAVPPPPDGFVVDAPAPQPQAAPRDLLGGIAAESLESFQRSAPDFERRVQERREFRAEDAEASARARQQQATEPPPPPPGFVVDPPAEQQRPKPIWQPGSGYDLAAAQPLLDAGVRPEWLKLDKVPDGGTVRVGGFELTKGTDEAGRPIVTGFTESPSPPAARDALPPPPAPETPPQAGAAAVQPADAVAPAIAQPLVTPPGIAARQTVGESADAPGAAEPLPRAGGEPQSAALPSEADRAVTPVEPPAPQPVKVKSGPGWDLERRKVQAAIEAAQRSADQAKQPQRPGAPAVKVVKNPPRGRVEQFRGEEWADTFLAGRAPARPERPDSPAVRRAELTAQLKRVLIERHGPEAGDNKNLADQANASNRPELLLSDAKALAMADAEPEGSPARMLAHNLRELVKNPRGTRLQPVNTNDVPDGTRVVVNDGETFEIDHSNGLVRDGITSEIPPEGMTLVGKKVLPPEEGGAVEFSPPPTPKPAFYEGGPSQAQPGIFGQPEILSSGIGEQKPMFHEPVKIDAPAAERVGSKSATDPRNTQPIPFSVRPDDPQTESPEFRAWFGESRTVNHNGAPRVLYHGTDRAGFNTFSPRRAGSRTNADRARGGGSYDEVSRLGHFFTENPKAAAEHASGWGDEKAPAVMPAYVSLQNPLEIEGAYKGREYLNSMEYAARMAAEYGGGERWARRLQEQGYDGIILRDPQDGDFGDQYIAFRPEQIKSATGNRGTFDPENPDIRMSQGSGGGLTADVARRAIGRVQSEFPNLPVNVVETEAQLPAGLREEIRSRSAEGKVEALVDEGGRVHLIAGNVKDEARAVRAAFHEIVGHLGADATLKPEHRDRLMRFAGKNAPELVRGVMRDYKPREHLSETIARLSERFAGTERPAWYKQILQQIRFAWRRATGQDYDLGDVEALITQSRKRAGRKGFVAIGPTPKPPRGRPPGMSLDPETRVESVRRMLQDEFIAIKRLTRDVVASGGKLTEDTDPYLRTELFKGRVAEQQDALETAYVEPITRAIADGGMEVKTDADGRMEIAAPGLPTVDQYLIALHAPERNATIAARNPAMPDGGSGMSDAEAAQIVAQVSAAPQAMAYKRIASAVRRMNLETLQRSRDAGLISADSFDELSKRWTNYVPLRTDMEADGMGNLRPGGGFSVRGKEFKAATGRTSEADSPLTFSLMQANEKIIRAEKNRVAQSLHKLVADNPAPDLWEIDKTPMARTLDASGQVRETPDPRVQLADNVVSVKVDGRTHWITFKTDEGKLIARAVKRLGYQDGGKIIQKLAAGMRAYASLQTSRNPEFVIPNLVRDAQTAGLNLSADESAAMASKTIKAMPKAWRAMWDVLGDRAAKPGEKLHDYAREFMTTGGKIAAYSLRDFRGTQKALQAQLRDITGKNKLLRAAKTANAFIERVNDSTENAVRLSAYAAAREAGMSPQKAASLAKNLTVNFERKGEAGTFVNSLYLFANAGIQGNARLLKSMATTKRGRKITGGIAASGLAYGLVAPLLFGEDEEGRNVYDTIPEHEKQTHLIIPFGGKRYGKLPMPYGYNVLFTAGRTLGETINGHKKPAAAAMSAMGAALNAFNPLGNESTPLQNLAPTLLDPAVQSAENKDWAGRRIVPEQSPFGPQKPQSQLFDRGTSAYAKAVAQFLAAASGGDRVTPGKIDVSPNTIEHFVDWAIGGAGRFVTKTAELPGRIARGDVTPRTVPIASRFVGQQPAGLNARDFGEMDKRSEQARWQVRRYLEAGDVEKARKVYAENRVDIVLAPRLNATAKQLKTIREMPDAKAAREAEDKLLSSLVKWRRGDAKLPPSELWLTVRELDAKDAVGFYQAATDEDRQVLRRAIMQKVLRAQMPVPQKRALVQQLR